MLLRKDGRLIVIQEKKLCGSSSSTHQYCVDSNENCPINFLTFALNGKSTSTLSSIDVSTTKILYYSSTEDYNPIVDFRITEGSGVCLLNDYFNYDYGRTLHPLSLFGSICDQLDSRFGELDSIKESSFFYANSKY